MNLLLVEDKLSERALLTAYLEDMGHSVEQGGNGQEAVDLYAQHDFDLVLMDVTMPVMDGHEAATQIREIYDQWVPIIFLSGRVRPEDVVVGINAGGDDYLTKPVNPDVLAAKMSAMQRIANMKSELHRVSRQLEEANQELEKQAYFDALTGLHNRRYLDWSLAREVAKHVRNEQYLSVMMIDVDYFKVFNDMYGHQQGDECLQHVSSLMRSGLLRVSDDVARYGGEEFAVVLPATAEEKAVLCAERIRQSLYESNFEHKGSDIDNRVTVSIGVATMQPGKKETQESLLQRADDALYDAKRDGRNRIRVNVKE